MAMNSGLEGSVKDMVELAGRIGKGDGKEPRDGEPSGGDGAANGRIAMWDT
jgi:hypothetical protein